MKLLITGSTGFIGSHFIRSLSAKGIDFVVLIRPSSDTCYFEENDIAYIVDQGNTELLHQSILEAGCTGVFHLATLFIAEHSSDDIPSLIESNITFSTRLVDACLNTSIRWFVNIGTFWQYYRGSDYCPMNLYAATKQAFMDVLAYYQDSSDIVFTHLMLNDTYGPNDPRPKLISILTSQPKDPILLSPGDQKLDMTYIDDVLSGFYHLITLLESSERTQHNGSSYRLSYGEPLTLKEIVGTLEEVYSLKANVKWGARPYRKREVMVPWQGGTSLPGWEACVGLKEGLERIRYYDNT